MSDDHEQQLNPEPKTRFVYMRCLLPYTIQRCRLSTVARLPESQARAFIPMFRPAHPHPFVRP